MSLDWHQQQRLSDEQLLLCVTLQVKNAYLAELLQQLLSTAAEHYYCRALLCSC